MLPLFITIYFEKPHTESNVTIKENILICYFRSSLSFISLLTIRNPTAEDHVNQCNRETVFLSKGHEHCFYLRGYSRIVNKITLYRFYSNSIMWVFLLLETEFSVISWFSQDVTFNQILFERPNRFVLAMPLLMLSFFILLGI